VAEDKKNLAQPMNWDIFKGFWLGVISLLFVEFSLIWSVDETKDDDYNHFQPT
jgi:hypothetical protein